MIDGPHTTPPDEPAANFARRHIGPSPREIAAMLETVGATSLDDADRRRRCRRRSGRTRRSISAAPLTETEALAHLRALAAQNQVFTSLIGQGYYGTITAAGDPAQHPGEPGLVHGLHALPAGDQPGPAGGAAQLPDHGQRPDRPRIANASLLDEATAAAEAMAHGASASRKSKANAFFVDRDVPSADASRCCGPAPSRSAGTSIVGDPLRRSRRRPTCSARCFQYPGTSGAVRDFRPADRDAARKPARSPSSPPICWR